MPLNALTHIRTVGEIVAEVRRLVPSRSLSHDPKTDADRRAGGGGATRAACAPSSMTARRAVPYAELLAQALSAAARSPPQGLEPGDRVALVVPQVGDFIQALFAILAAGLIPVPLVPPVQAGDVLTFRRQSRQLLAASRASAVVTTADVAPLLDLSAL